MSDILFFDDKRTDPTGYDAALRNLNIYFGADPESECTEDLKMLDRMWAGQKCACGCEDCWLFTPSRGAMGPIAFWVHGDKVMLDSITNESTYVVHDALLAA